MDRSRDCKSCRSAVESGLKIIAYSTVFSVAGVISSSIKSWAATVTVDAGDIIRDDISPKTFASGVAHEDAQFNQLMGSTQVANPTGHTMVSDLKLGGMRFPMGTSALYYYWDHPSWSYPGAVTGDEVISLRPQTVPERDANNNLVYRDYPGMYSYIAGLGMDPIFQVNTFSSIDPANNTHFVNPTLAAPGVIDTGQLETTSDYAGAWVTDYQNWRSSNLSAAPDQFWEVGNEDWSWWSPSNYAQIFAKYAAKMKAQKSDIKLLAETLTHPWTVGSNAATKITNDDTWTTTFAQTLANNGADLKSIYALSYHQYFGSPLTPRYPENFSFETPVVTGTSSRTICNSDPALSGSGWTFTGNAGWSAGIAGDVPNQGSVWGSPASPHGSQVAIIQGTSKITSTQALSLQYGVTYTVTVKAAQRANPDGTPQSQVIAVKVNGIFIGNITPTTTALTPISVPFTFSGAPTANVAVTLSFEGTATGDQSAFIDDITITDRTPDQYRRAQTQYMSSMVNEANDLNTLLSKVKAVNNTYNVGWKIWGTEFNQQQDDPTGPIGIADAQDIGQGMVIADWAGRMLELGVERMVMHSLDQHPCFSIIEYANNGSSPTSPFMSVPGWAYSIYPQKFGSTMVRVSYSGNPTIHVQDPTYVQDPHVDDIPQLSAYASLTSDRTQLRMIVVNRDVTNAAPLTIETRNGSMNTGATYRQLYSANISDNNSGTTHPIKWSDPATFVNGQSVPAHSVTYVEIPLASVIAQPTNFSFEFPALSPGLAASNSAGATDARLNPNSATGGDARVGWTFTGGAAWGVAGTTTYGSAWGNPAAPSASETPAPDVTGTQFGVIQHDSAISQSLPWQSNTNYWISVSAAQRSGNAQSVNVKVGSVVVGTLNTTNVPGDGKFHTCILGPFTPTANGNQILTFQGLSANDDTIFLDNVRISGVTSGVSYRLAPAAAPDKRLNITGTVTGSGVNYALSNNGNSQKWLFTRSTGTIFTLAPTSASGLRLNANGTAGGSAVSGVTSAGSTAQKWSLSKVSGGFTLIPQNTTTCRLNASGTSTVNVATFSATNPTPQVWNLIR